MTAGDDAGREARRREILIDYTNHRGERAWRRIVPEEGGNYFGTTPDHTEPTWLMRAKALDRGGAPRTFAVKDIHGFAPGWHEIREGGRIAYPMPRPEDW